MDVEKILKLVDAGFTKEEIVKLANYEKATPKFDVTNSETPKEEKPEASKEEKPETPKEDPAKIDPATELNAAVEKALKPFEDLYNNMAKLAAMPSMEKVEPKGIDDIIDSFFKGD